MKKLFYGFILFMSIFMINGCKKETVEPVVYNDTDFNVKLIKTVNSINKGNYLVSPYSIEIALSMLKSGASNNTLKEIENVVGTRNINDARNDKVKIANAMFLKDKYKNYIEESFINSIKNNYNGEVLIDEFKTPKVINDWVKLHTDNMIEKILDNMSKDFVLGLSNAIAIDVEWLNSFECNNTTRAIFTKNDDKKINVEMMHKTYTSSDYKYLDSEDEKIVLLPYKNDLEFIGILPNDINKYIENLSKEKLDNIDSNLKDASNDIRLSLALPRFSYTYNMEKFKEVLISMGIKDAFDENSADFTKIISKDNMNSTDINNLYVGEAIHKTYIDLNEKGTKAAAVTYFGMFKNSAMIEKYETVEITFDKPFIYMIRDTKNKEILFFGVTYEPNIWNGTTCTEA